MSKIDDKEMGEMVELVINSNLARYAKLSGLTEEKVEELCMELLLKQMYYTYNKGE